MVGSQVLHLDCQDSLIKLLRLGPVALSVMQRSKIIQGRGNFEVIAPVSLLGYVSRAPIERLRLLILFLAPKDGGQ